MTFFPELIGGHAELPPVLLLVPEAVGLVLLLRRGQRRDAGVGIDWIWGRVTGIFPRKG
jgi:hypothetical protein